MSDPHMDWRITFPVADCMHSAHFGPDFHPLPSSSGRELHRAFLLVWRNLLGKPTLPPLSGFLVTTTRSIWTADKVVTAQSKTSSSKEGLKSVGRNLQRLPCFEGKLAWPECWLRPSHDVPFFMGYNILKETSTTFDCQEKN